MRFMCSVHHYVFNEMSAWGIVSSVFTSLIMCVGVSVWYAGVFCMNLVQSMLYVSSGQRPRNRVYL